MSIYHLSNRLACYSRSFFHPTSPWSFHLSGHCVPVKSHASGLIWSTSPLTISTSHNETKPLSPWLNFASILSLRRIENWNSFSSLLLSHLFNWSRTRVCVTTFAGFSPATENRELWWRSLPNMARRYHTHWPVPHTGHICFRRSLTFAGTTQRTFALPSSRFRYHTHNTFALPYSRCLYHTRQYHTHRTFALGSSLSLSRGEDLDNTAAPIPQWTYCQDHCVILRALSHCQFGRICHLSWQLGHNI